MSFDPSTAVFNLTYHVNPAVHSPTVVFVPVAAEGHGADPPASHRPASGCDS